MREVQNLENRDIHTYAYDLLLLYSYYEIHFKLEVRIMYNARVQELPRSRIGSSELLSHIMYSSSLYMLSLFFGNLSGKR